MNKNVFRVIREYFDFTQAELAEELGLSKALISDLETGRRPPSRKAIDAFNNYFDLDDYQLTALSTALDADGNLPPLSQLVLKLIKFQSSKNQGRNDRGKMTKVSSLGIKQGGFLKPFRRDLNTNKETVNV